MSENERIWHYRELSTEQLKAKSDLLIRHIEMYRTLKDFSGDHINTIKRYDNLKHDCIRQYSLITRVLHELEAVAV